MPQSTDQFLGEWGIRTELCSLPDRPKLIDRLAACGSRLSVLQRSAQDRDRFG